MTLTEFSNEFDILFNNIMSNQAPGLDEYEKSVFLTSAQEELVISLYNGKNQFGDSFEKTEELRRYLSNLIKSTSIDRELEDPTITKIVENSKLYELPKDLWFITYETVDFEDKKGVEVVPVTQDSYHRIHKNPFRGATKNRVLRLDYKDKVELVSNSNNSINKYNLRYIVKLPPIILKNLSYGLKINGQSAESDCILHEALHRPILEKAVQKASISWSHNVNK